MLKFESLGDGNCLYNTEAVLLVHAYQQGALEPLMKDKDFVHNLGELLIQVHQTNQDEIKLSGLKAPFTEKSVKKAFDDLLAQFAAKGKKKATDWVKLQLTMAKGLRAQVVNAIEKDEAIKKEITKELSHALDQSIEMSWVEKKESSKDNSDEDEVSDDEREIHLSYHFEDMPEIEEKVAEVLDNDRLKTLKQKQDALKKWFFQGKQEGLNYYLYGEQGITTEAIHSGELELKILSRLFHHVSRFSAHGIRTRIIDGFKDAEQAKKYARDTLVFTTEKLINHWNAELPESLLSKKILQEYKPQRTQYLRTKQKTENALHLDKILEKYDSYADHHEQELSAISVAQYCKVHGLTKKQYENNLLPQTQGKVVKEKDKQQPKNNKKDKGRKPKEKVDQKPKSSKKAKAKSSPDVSKSDESKKERDWANYGTMLFAIFAVTALASHCLIWPLLLPLLDSLFIGTAIGHNLCWLTSGITAIFSLSLGWLLTEKIYAEGEAESAENEGTASKFWEPTQDKGCNVSDLLYGVKPFLRLYQNQSAQLQNNETITENNPHLRNVRNRLH